MVELIDHGNGSCTRTFGGDTLNTAVYLARCATKEVSVHYVTALGDDPLSQEMLENWQLEGLVTDSVECVPGKVPGLYMIQTDEYGERSFQYWRDQAPVKKLFQTDNSEKLVSKLQSLDWIFYTGITLAVLEPEGQRKLLDFLKDFRAQGGKVAFDVNYRPKLWQGQDAKNLISEAYRCCDLALPSIDDEQALWLDQDLQSTLDRLKYLGCENLVIKQGQDPCLVVSGEKIEEIEVIAAGTVVDTTAAGDSFNGAFLASFLQGESVSVAVKKGQNIARQVVAKQGAIVPIQCQTLKS